MRDEAQLHRFTFLNTAGAYGLLSNTSPRRRPLVRRPQGPGRRSPAPSRKDVAISEASDRAARRWMRENPGRAAALYFRKFGIIFRQTNLVAGFAIARKASSRRRRASTYPRAAFLEETPVRGHDVAGLAGWLAVLLGVLGWIRLLGRALGTRKAADFVPALVLRPPPLRLPVISALIAVNGRYRWPVEDLILPAAAYAVTRAWQRIQAESGRSRPPRPRRRLRRNPAESRLSRFEWRSS